MAVVDEGRGEVQECFSVGRGEISSDHATAKHVSHLGVDKMWRVASIGSEPSAQVRCLRGPAQERNDHR